MNRAHKGFTIIELVLAMTFISVLLLAIAMTILQISKEYNKGLTLTDINQSARSIATDLQKSVTASAPFALTGASAQYINMPWGGRLCLGQYSYIWNYGTTLATKTPANSNVYTASANLIRFVKVSDPTSAYCQAPTSKIDATKATELLMASDHDIAVQQFAVASQDSAYDSKTGERLYTISFYIGTNTQSALKNNSTTCKQPGESGADPQFCSVQKFSIVVSTSSTGS